MFGSRSKEQKPPTPWSIQILTSEYLVDGLMPDPHGGTFQALLSMGSDAKLASAQVQPTGILTTPSTSYPEWTPGPATIAVILRDDASMKAAADYSNSFGLKHSIRAVVYVGPYLIRGILKSPHKDIRTTTIHVVSSSTKEWFMTDAEIDCLAPGTRLRQLQAPQLVVLAHTMIHGFHLTQA